ncbi:hypothetical protein B7P43_G14287 [Cryptotermes secundus]|uniref:Uncharacterized protein n=1 Tax=Cryptotermes secundus TaxID=105785 RepID=A0A2J7QYG1_9NEOP|nr:hypothetical protein B7P43_G14287 [Cryptotermes secundus]
MHDTTETVPLSSFLNSELPLPLYDDATEMNAVFHIRKLEEFMNFRNVPQQLRLAVACRSIVGQIGRQWVEALKLKYATMASYLDPRPSDADLIEAIKSHFPITVQRAMLTSQLCTVEETLDLLKRIEITQVS